MEEVKLIKILFATVIISTILFLTGSCSHADWNKSTKETVEDEMWKLVAEYSPNDTTTAAVFGWFYRESKLDSSALSGVKDSSKFISEIDSGLEDGSTRERFIRDVSQKYGGFGLGQWCSECYVSALYDFAQTWGTSIADKEMQVAFAFHYMKETNPWNIWEHLETATDPYATGLMIGKFIDGTLLPESIAWDSKYFYDKYVKEKK